jgi:hypothetical protein
LLIDEGKIEAAVRLMRQVLANKPGLVIEFARALVAARAAEAAWWRSSPSTHKQRAARRGAWTGW